MDVKLKDVSEDFFRKFWEEFTSMEITFKVDFLGIDRCFPERCSLKTDVKLQALKS